MDNKFVGLDSVKLRLHIGKLLEQHVEQSRQSVCDVDGCMLVEHKLIGIVVDSVRLRLNIDKLLGLHDEQLRRLVYGVDGCMLAEHKLIDIVVDSLRVVRLVVGSLDDGQSMLHQYEHQLLHG